MGMVSCQEDISEQFDENCRCNGWKGATPLSRRPSCRLLPWVKKEKVLPKSGPTHVVIRSVVRPAIRDEWQPHRIVVAVGNRSPFGEPYHPPHAGRRGRNSR